MAVTYKKPIDDEVPWEQRLANYASNRDAGKSEYQRALEVYRTKSALGDTEGAGAAQQWAGQVRTAVGDDAFDPVKSGISSMLNRQPDPNQAAMRQALKDRINRPVQQFSYDQNSDPAYQNALRSAQANATTAQNNTLANLRARGQGKSSYSETVANQIQQKELGKVTSDVLPQLMSQAYQRYAGQQQLENQQLGNMFNLANMNDNQDARQYSQLAQALGLQQGYNQQQFQNERALTAEERQRQQDHIGLADRLTQMYGKTVNPTEDPGQSYAQVEGLTPLAMQQYLQQKAMQEAGLTGNYNGAPTMQREGMSFDQGLRNKQFGLSERQASASIANMGAGNARANESNTLARDRFDFEKEQARIKNSNQKPETNDIFAEIVGNLDSMTPEERKAFLKGEKQSLIRDLGINGYNSVYGQYFDKYGDPIE